jgi:hypothetical protein
VVAVALFLFFLPEILASAAVAAIVEGIVWCVTALGTWIAANWAAILAFGPAILKGAQQLLPTLEQGFQQFAPAMP